MRGGPTGSLREAQPGRCRRKAVPAGPTGTSRRRWRRSTGAAKRKKLRRTAVHMAAAAPPAPLPATPAPAFPGGPDGGCEFWPPRSRFAGTGSPARIAARIVAAVARLMPAASAAAALIASCGTRAASSAGDANGGSRPAAAPAAWSRDALRARASEGRAALGVETATLGAAPDETCATAGRVAESDSGTKTGTGAATGIPEGMSEAVVGDATFAATPGCGSTGTVG